MEKRTDTSAGGQETAMRPAEQAAPAESAKCDAGVSEEVRAINRQADQILLVEVSVMALQADTTYRDFFKLEKQEQLAYFARNGRQFALRRAAVTKLTSQDVLVELLETEKENFVRAEIVRRLDNAHRRAVCGKLPDTPHAWNGCTCTVCGERRPGGHDFAPVDGQCLERCTICGTERGGNHEFEGCTCTRCGARREFAHHFVPIKGECRMRCEICGMVKPGNHRWVGCTCIRCGKERDEKHRFAPMPGRPCMEACTVCGQTRSVEHQFAYSMEHHEPRCVNCGVPIPLQKPRQDAYVYTNIASCAPPFGLERVHEEEMQELVSHARWPEDKALGILANTLHELTHLDDEAVFAELPDGEEYLAAARGILNTHPCEVMRVSVSKKLIEAGDRAALDALLHWIEPRRDELVYDFGAAYAILRAAYEKFSEAERERIRSICTAQPYHDDAMRYHDGHYGHVDDARTFELFPD